jgi:hypothetical protein
MRQLPLIKQQTTTLFVPSVDLTGAADVASRANYTLITKIPIAAIRASGTRGRLVLVSSGKTHTLNNVRLGYTAKAVGANAWDCEPGTCVDLKQNGGNAWTLTGPRGTEHASDVFALDINALSTLVVAINVGAESDATWRLSKLTGYGIDTITYEKSGVQEATSDTRSTNYSGSRGRSYLLKRLEVGS